MESTASDDICHLSKTENCNFLSELETTFHHNVRFSNYLHFEIFQKVQEVMDLKIVSAVGDNNFQLSETENRLLTNFYRS